MANLPRSTDHDLLALLASQSEQALTFLFDEYYDMLIEAIRGYVTSQADADNIVHELLWHVYQNHGTLNITRPVSAYLVTAALNRTRNLLRDRARKREVLINPGDLHAFENMRLDIPADSGLNVNDIYRLLEKAKNRMGWRVRLTFALSRNRHLTYAQIAEWMGITVKGVERNMTVALKILTEVFKHYREVIVLLAAQIFYG